MSEQGPLQSSVGVFVEWAKARLDEMAASAKVLGFDYWQGSPAEKFA